MKKRNIFNAQVYVENNTLLLRSKLPDYNWSTGGHSDTYIMNLPFNQFR